MAKKSGRRSKNIEDRRVSEKLAAEERERLRHRGNLTAYMAGGTFPFKKTPAWVRDDRIKKASLDRGFTTPSRVTLQSPIFDTEGLEDKRSASERRNSFMTPSLIADLEQRASQQGGAIAQNEENAMPGLNEFFQGAGNDLLQQDDQLAQGLSAELAQMQLQKKQMQRVLTVANALGEDVSALVPLMQQFDQRQQMLMQSMQAKTQLPSAASTPQVNIPAPQMPRR